MYDSSRKPMARLWPLFLLFLSLATRSHAAQVTIYRDSYGVPSIVADTLPEAAYGLGYAMTQDNAERMARNFKQARGRLAEADGQSQLLTDGFLRSLGIEELAEQKAKTLQGETAQILQSFCDGANKALAEQKSRLPDWIEPFTVVDVLALAQLMNAAFPLMDIAGQLMPSTGSNQFAVAPQRSATGNAILSIDPHLTWSGPLLWYEYALYTKEFAFRGITVCGGPFGVMGHTEKIAWSITNNSPDLYDFFTVKTNPNNPKQYSYHGAWRDFEEVTFEMRYREGGQLKSRTQKARRTAWGPMVPLRSQAVRLAMLGSWELLEQMPRMARAGSAREFREALRPLGLSMWNFVYADTQGNIGYQYNARVPRRDESFDWTKPVPGDDPKTQWGALWTLDELPRVENPKSNLLVNGNSAPWLTPLGTEIPESGWPKYVTRYGHTTRYDRLAALLSADERITIANAKRYATDTLVPYALKTVQALRRAATSSPMAAELKSALEVLTTWDGRADTDSKGCGLYLFWYLAAKETPELARKADRGETWSEPEAAAALVALQKAAMEIRQKHGRLDIPWGTLHFSRRGDSSAPVSGFAYVLGSTSGNEVATVAPNFGTFKDGVISCTGGSSFRMIVELNPQGVTSWSILPYGNSQDLTNRHFADQMPMFGRGEYKETHFGRTHLKRYAVSTQVLNRQ